jgi:short-subunit dehydrogenase
MRWSLSDKVVFITGVSSGIGRALAVEFARKGVRVVGIARRIDRLSALEVEINTFAQGHFLGLQADVTDAEAVRMAVDQAVTHFGQLDILVANAGIGQRGAVVEAAWHDLETVLRTNIDGVYHSVRAAVPYMRKQGGGHIVIVSSVVYNLVAPYTASYAASKAFVSSLAQSLALELSPENIAVTDVRVGRTETEFNDKRLGHGKRSAGSGFRLVPVMPVERVAQTIVGEAARPNPRRILVIRLFDRLLMWANMFIPNAIGQLAMRQYKG